MTSKTFTSGTVVDSPWLNDVNTATYTSVPALQTKTANLPTVSTFAGTMMDDVKIYKSSVIGKKKSNFIVTPK